MPAYYLHIDDQVQGPYSEDEVKSRFDTGTLQPDTQVCADGGEWVRLADAFPSLYSEPSRPEPHAVSGTISQTSQIFPPEQSAAIASDQAQTYEGIGRRDFAGYLFVFGLIVGGFISMATQQSSSPGNFKWSAWMLIPDGLMLIPAVLRLKNIGSNPAWSILLFLPLIDMFFTATCLTLPAGYQDHRKLDLAAKIIGGGFLAIIIVVLFVVIGIPMGLGS
jgi:hypothetical protein